MTHRLVQLPPRNHSPHGPANQDQTVGTDNAEDATVPLQDTPGNGPHGYTAAITTPSGIKRRRSGSIASHQYHAWNYYDASSSFTCGNVSSESSDSESSADSEDSFDSDDEELSDVEEIATDYGDSFRDALRNSVNLSYSAFQDWEGSKRYVAPPNDRLPPRKRARTSGSAYVKGLNGNTSSEHVTISAAGYFHLACPFYLSNPEKYKDCLLEHDLQSVEAVIQHLKRHHKRPPYCPRCYEVFARVLDRDHHILAGRCKLSDRKKHMDGLSDYQQERLSKRDRLYYGEATRWKRIWTTVFPDFKLRPSPYLDHGCGLRVSLARDYWRGQGQNLVSELLHSWGFYETRGKSERRQLALSRLILRDLLVRVCEEDKVRPNCALEIRIKAETK